MYKIQKGIPIASDARTYPFERMDIGDSFLVKGDAKKRNSASVAVAAYKKKNVGTNFVTRTVKDGLRIWRTA